MGIFVRGRFLMVLHPLPLFVRIRIIVRLGDDGVVSHRIFEFLIIYFFIAQFPGSVVSTSESSHP